MATARGILTVSDVSDGAPSVSIFQTNENHTFTAGSDAVVSAAVYGAFNNDIVVLIADTQATYVTTTPTANNTYTVGAPTVTPTGGVTTAVSTNAQAPIAGGANINVARITVTAVSSTINSTTVVYPVTVRRLNVNVTYNIQITFSKAVGGAAENIVLTANRQTFLYAGSESIVASVDGDITLSALYDGSAADTYIWTRDIVLRDGTAHATGQAVTGTTLTQTLTAAQFNGAGATAGDVGSITYRVQRGDVIDRVSIIRLNTGDNAFAIVPRVTAGMANLKNNTGSVTFVADLFEGANEVADLTGWTFVWNGPPSNDADGTRGTITSATTGITLADFNNGTNAQITVAAAYIEDDMGASITVVGTNS